MGSLEGLATAQPVLAARRPVPLAQRLGHAGLHAIVILLCLLTIFPLLWMLSTAIKPGPEVFRPGVHLIPDAPTFDNFPEAFRAFPIGWWFFNSTIIAVATTLGKLAVSLPAAYAFTRLDFPGRRLCFSLVLGTMIVPFVVTVIPSYLIVAKLDWLNTRLGVIVPSVAHTAFYVFLLRQYIMTLPQELFDAARIDGAGPATILWRIVMPNVRPAIAVVTILAFLAAWNQYIWPLLVLNEINTKTLAVGMQFFARNSDSTQLWGAMMATATLATIPPLTLYAFAQKRIISTFVTSGIKG
ncbi:MAG: carbohydrate ABC transporter permease [Chloroflexi bacterium]|nr:carbohydrate ABC transporter permease [Chloroflexota bacterium]